MLISPITNYGPENTLAVVHLAWETKATELAALKIEELLIAFIIYLFTAISLCLIGIDLDWPYILFNPSFVNLYFKR